MSEQAAAEPMSHSALSWRGDLADLTTEQLRERADSMAWWIANNVARGESPSDRHGSRNDPVVEFREARDAWFAPQPPDAPANGGGPSVDPGQRGEGRHASERQSVGSHAPHPR